MHSFDGWENFLLDNGFGEWRMRPVLKKKMVYVPRQKRLRVLQCDETHQIMSTELEKGGTRANVYADVELGASGRSTVVNARHISGMCVAAAAAAPRRPRGVGVVEVPPCLKRP